jgi:hypothetical protein
MRKPVRSNSRLRVRVEELGREVSRLDGEIRGLSRAVDHPDREAAARRLRRLFEEQSRPKPPPVPAPVPEPAARGPVERPLPAEREPPLSADAAAVPDMEMGAEPEGTAARSRFASYFVTGGLQALQPLRQERRVQRNKAIFMLVVAAVLLYAVISQLL